MTLMRHTRTTLGALLGAIMIAGAGAPAKANSQTGVASWYQMGHTTANGEKYNPDGMTAAHPSLPFGTVVQVENLNNGRSVRLRIYDRGPFVGCRIFVVIRGGARQVGLIATGTARVKVTTLYSGSRTSSAAQLTSGGKDWRCRAVGMCS